MGCFWRDLRNAVCRQDDAVNIPPIDISQLIHIGEQSVSPIFGSGTYFQDLSVSRDGNYIYVSTNNGIGDTQRGTFGTVGDISSVTWSAGPGDGYDQISFTDGGSKMAMLGNGDMYFYDTSPAFLQPPFAEWVGRITSSPNIGQHGTYVGAGEYFISNNFGLLTRFTPSPYPTSWTRYSVSLGVDALYDSYGAIFSSDGLTMLTWDTEAYSANPDEQFLVQYSLSAPFDIDTLSLDYLISMAEWYGPWMIRGLALKHDDSGIYVVGEPITGNNLTIKEFNFV